jgi:hypothetical protein
VGWSTQIFTACQEWCLMQDGCKRWPLRDYWSQWFFWWLHQLLLRRHRVLTLLRTFTPLRHLVKNFNWYPWGPFCLSGPEQYESSWSGAFRCYGIGCFWRNNFCQWPSW